MKRITTDAVINLLKLTIKLKNQFKNCRNLEIRQLMFTPVYLFSLYIIGNVGIPIARKIWGYPLHRLANVMDTAATYGEGIDRSH